MGMGNLKNKCKQAPYYPSKPEKEPCLEFFCQSQSLNCNRGFRFVEGPGNDKDHERVGDVASNSFGNELFLESKEDEDKDPCEKRRAY